MNATNCQNHETVTESPAYLIGFMDGKSKKDTNADRIRAMTDEELAMYFAGMADEDIYNDPGAWLAWLQNSYKEGAE